MWICGLLCFVDFCVDVLCECGMWWDWDDVKFVFEYFWCMGDVVISGWCGFECMYVLVEYVILFDICL